MPAGVIAVLRQFLFLVIAVDGLMNVRRRIIQREFLTVTIIKANVAWNHRTAMAGSKTRGKAESFTHSNGALNLVLDISIMRSLGGCR